MKAKQIVAIDVGSSNVVIAVGAVEDDGRVEIRGIVSEPVNGVNAGRIENSDTVGQAIAAAKQRIESQLDVRITEAYAGLSGDFIRCVQLTDHVYVQDELRNGSNQITQRDIDDLDRRMRSVKLPDEREMIITMEPMRYKIDEREVEIPVGSYGHVLSATYNFILCDKSMRDRLRLCLQRQGITVKEFVPNALVSHLSVATTEDMQDGAVVVDLGGGVTDVTVLLGGKVRYIASIPIGADAINSDIRSSSIPSNYVEDLKIQHGAAIAEFADDDMIVFQSARRGMVKSILRKNLATIIEARLTEIAEWVRREIKDAGCGSKFMPVVLLTGGGSVMRDIERLFARELKIDDVRAVYPEYGFVEESLTKHITTPAYATIASLLLYGATHGSCAVVAGGATRQSAPAPTQEEDVQEKQTIKSPQREPEVARDVPAHEQEKTVAVNDDDDFDMDIDAGDIEDDVVPKRKGLMGRFRNLLDRMGNTFTEVEDDNDF